MFVESYELIHTFWHPDATCYCPLRHLMQFGSETVAFGRYVFGQFAAIPRRWIATSFAVQARTGFLRMSIKRLYGRAEVSSIQNQAPFDPASTDHLINPHAYKAAGISSLLSPNPAHKAYKMKFTSAVSAAAIGFVSLSSAISGEYSAKAPHSNLI